MILNRILEHKRAEIRRKQSRGYLSELRTKIRDAGRPREFTIALDAIASPGRPALIAEVKKASPSLGLLREEFKEQFDPVAIAQGYKEHGAAALSVLTDAEFFQGSLDDLGAVTKKVGLPTLNKEFMVHDLQFYEARAHGADAVLLIVAALERGQMQEFDALARELHLDVLIEVHHERELDLVLEWLPQARLLGINNRDLHTFTTDLSVTERLATRIPSDKVIVSESGLQTRADVERISKAGAKAMLIGESLIRADDAKAKIRDLLGLASEGEERS